ncbi:hypothetical protein [Rhizobium sp.]|uniref:hypothetical protein n=1 Tax=Rhizobium sp. TaxID=391 RepID=UPI003F802717
MIRSSQKLATLRDAMLNHASIGGSISAVIAAEICKLLDYVISDCENMEKRLAGDLLVARDAGDGKVISLVVRALDAGNRQPGDVP